MHIKYLTNMKTDMDLRNMSDSTQEAYLRRIAIFLEDVKKDILSISVDDIRKYIIYLKDDKKLSIGTIKAYISAIRFFYTITLEKE